VMTIQYTTVLTVVLLKVQYCSDLVQVGVPDVEALGVRPQHFLEDPSAPLLGPVPVLQQRRLSEHLRLASGENREEKVQSRQ